MATSIHGHEMMQMMVELDRSFSRESLRQAIQERFGDNARFFTCSARDRTADQLIDFLAGRGKFVERDKGFSTRPEHICQH
ncbi:MAG: YecH family protein [Verrucomicrobia bacterium]|nr:YecH family protein [Verrucomicrobiota bacterium]